ncbi:transposase [Reticulibacter mediterranei]|uniref:Transposase n=1 Tax=Reticulibacter mediterranei TaxID=2778369 RepID=A0A8J3IAA2_9CHLR|nr:transposase [Reticulibacter mediterranei]
MKFQFIEDHRQEYAVKTMCRTLSVSECGYYAWRKRPKSEREQKNEELTQHIQQIFEHNRQIYGSPRIHVELNDLGVKCSRKHVARLMRAAGISAGQKRRRVRTTDSSHKNPVADNRLNREFNAFAPNTRWTGDITGIETGQGWLYLAIILDLYSRKVVGWSMSLHRDEELVEKALKMALIQRCPKSGLMHHTDRGSQYTSQAYQGLLASAGITCSMSRKGNCWDNAPTESFFGTLKREWTHRHHYQTQTQARQSIFDYIETFYNRKRRHSALGYLSPVAYEQLNRKELETTV